MDFTTLVPRDRMRFIKQCRLRASCYGKALTSTTDPNDALEQLCAAAVAAQSNVAAALHVAHMEREWAADWVLDPRPDPPLRYCDFSTHRHLWGYEPCAAVMAKNPARARPMHGWPAQWYVTSE